MFKKDYTVINGTHEEDYVIYNVNIMRKKQACKVLQKLEKPSYIPIYPLPPHENINKHNVFFILNGTVKKTYRLYDNYKKTIDLSHSLKSSHKVFLYTDDNRFYKFFLFFNCLYFSNLNV